MRHVQRISKKAPATAGYDWDSYLVLFSTLASLVYGFSEMAKRLAPGGQN